METSALENSSESAKWVIKQEPSLKLFSDSTTVRSNNVEFNFPVLIIFHFQEWCEVQQYSRRHLDFPL